MNIRKIVLAVATIAALSPAISNASPERESLKACANAFATSIATPGAATPGYKLAYHGDVSSPLMEYPSDYTFMLEAHDAKGSAIARARCSTNARGEVTAISAVPLNSKPSALAASF
jgi:hypothetical protein